MKPGDLVSHYRIEAKIGEGGMGEVFVAQDETLKRKVALKTIRATHQLHSEARTRFTREARVLSQLDHPHICRIFDYITGDEGDLIVLELIEGQALHADYAKLTYAQKLAIAEEITSALVAAHAEGIVHRDLKPGNIMLTPMGGVKVLDFGLACVRNSNAPAGEEAPVAEASDVDIDVASWTDSKDSISGFHTELGSVFGTVQFMSPEQARGDLVGPASDMFSLGLVLQELFTGVPARHLKRSDGLMRAAAGESSPVVGVARVLAQLITRMKEVAPTRRPTAVEALARLRWIRATPQRSLRRGLAAGVIAVGLIGATKYTLDVRAGRTKAEELTAVNENTLGFMLGDFYAKLKPINRTDMLRGAAQRAVDYYASIPTESLRPNQLLNKAQSLIYFGLVCKEQGSLTDSLEAFDAALRLVDSPTAAILDPTRKDCLRREVLVWTGDVQQARGELDLAEQAYRQVADIPHAGPDGCGDSLSASAWDGRALMKRGEIAFYRGQLDQAGAFFTQARRCFGATGDRSAEERFYAGQVEFWFGNLFLERGDREAAAAPLQRYLEISEALAAEQPNDMNWRVEVAFAHHNLGALNQARGNPSAARDDFRRSIQSWQMLTVYDPENLEWRKELANTLSWLATNELTRWRPTDALDALHEEIAIRVDLTRRDPTNLAWLRLRAICENNLGDVLESLGSFAEARVYFTSAVEHARRLDDAEPNNAAWQIDLAVMLLRAGRNGIDIKDFTGAESYLVDMQRILDAEPTILEEQQRARNRVLCRVEWATLHLERNDDALAREKCELAESLLQAEIFAKAAKGARTDLSARIHLLRGRLLERAGDLSGARRECQLAMEALDDPDRWKAFSGWRAFTYVNATRIAQGREAVDLLFARFRDLGYDPQALGH